MSLKQYMLTTIAASAVTVTAFGAGMIAADDVKVKGELREACAAAKMNGAAANIVGGRYVETDNDKVNTAYAAYRQNKKKSYFTVEQTPNVTADNAKMKRVDPRVAALAISKEMVAKDCGCNK
jgi:hypothetical protein